VNGSVVVAAVAAAAARRRDGGENSNGNSIGPVRRLRPRYHITSSNLSSSLVGDSPTLTMTTAVAGEPGRCIANNNEHHSNGETVYHLAPAPADMYAASIRRGEDRNGDIDPSMVMLQHTTAPASNYDCSSFPLFSAINNNHPSFVTDANNVYCCSTIPSPILTASSFSSSISSPCSPSPLPLHYSRPGSSTLAAHYSPLLDAHPHDLSLFLPALAPCGSNTAVIPSTTTSASAVVANAQHGNDHVIPSSSFVMPYDSSVYPHEHGQQQQQSIVSASLPSLQQFHAMPHQYYQHEHHPSPPSQISLDHQTLVSPGYGISCG
jgi:hypothetical protein